MSLTPSAARGLRLVNLAPITVAIERRHTELLTRMGVDLAEPDADTTAAAVRIPRPSIAERLTAERLTAAWHVWRGGCRPLDENGNCSCRTCREEQEQIG